MATTAPLTQADQANQAKKNIRSLLDLHNSASSSRADRLLSTLEAGEGSLPLRNEIDNVLHHIAQNTGIEAHAAALNYSWANLRKFAHIKDKIAYVAGAHYAQNFMAAGSTTPTRMGVEDTELRRALDQVICTIETQLLTSQDFTESRILRHAAFNRFECKLSTQETGQLNLFANKLKKFCEKKGLDEQAEATDFAQETDAQKIIKITELIKQLNASDITVDEDIMHGIAQREAKIKPLRDLDKCYKQLINALDTMHSISRSTSSVMPNQVQQKKLKNILTDLGEDENKFIKELDAQNVNKESNYLFDQLYQLKKNKNLNEIITKYNITLDQFERRFLTYFGHNNVERARLQLDAQKQKTFDSDTKLKGFEQDADSRRGMVRQRIFDFHAHGAVGADGHWHFANVNEYNIANSYFNKFQDIFFAQEYGNPGQNQFRIMRDVMSAILRTRQPALLNGRRLFASGSVARKMFKFLENVLTQERRGFLHRIKKQWRWADDAEILSMMLMVKNENTNLMFYDNKNPFHKKEKWFGKIFRNISLTEVFRKEARDKIAPSTNKFLNIAEQSVKYVVAKPLQAISKANNQWIERKPYKRYKTLNYGLYPVSRLLGRQDKGYKAAKEFLGKASGKEVSGLYEGVTRTVDSITEGVASGIASIGKGLHNTYTTAQQRGVLDFLLDTASEENDLKKILQSTDLANLLNFKDAGPYIFEEDGRILPIDLPQNAKEDPVRAGKEMSEELNKQLETLLKQATRRNQEAKKDLATAKAGTDNDKERRAEVKAVETKNQGSHIKDIHGILARLSPILKKPMDGANHRRFAEIDTILTELQTDLHDKITALDIGTLTTQRNTAFTEQETLKLTIANAQRELDRVNAILSRSNIGQPAQAQLLADSQAIQAVQTTLIATSNIQLVEAKSRYFELKDQLSHREELIGRFEQIQKFEEEMRAINTAIHGNAGAQADIPSGEQREQLIQITKNMNILIDDESAVTTNSIIGTTNKAALETLTQEPGLAA